jgi:hypothetical protein
MRKATGLLVLLFASRLYADVSVVGPPVNPSVGDTFAVSVTVLGVVDLYAYQLDLTFDPTLLSALSVSEGPFLPTGGTTFFIPGTIDNVGGSVTATADSLIGPVPGVSGGGELLTFEFTALASGTSALSIANPILLDSSFDDITGDSNFQNGSVTISSSAVPEPGYLALCAILLVTVGIWRARQAWRPMPMGWKAAPSLERAVQEQPFRLASME